MPEIHNKIRIRIKKITEAANRDELMKIVVVYFWPLKA